MSGLLPRVQESSGSGSFDSLSVQTLTVSAAAYINNLTAGSINLDDLTLSNLTTSTITGNPNLAITGGSVTINGGTVLTADSVDTLTNKTISVTDNAILMDNIVGGFNIVDVIDQQMKTTDNVVFGSVETVGAMIAGSGVSGGFGYFDVINSEAIDNTATVNGVNPLDTATTLAANVNQSVTTTANVTFNSIVSLWGGKKQTFHGTGSVLGGGFIPIIMYTLVMVPNMTYMIKIKLLGRVTAGPQVGNGYNQTSTSGVTTDSDGFAVNLNYIYQDSVAANGVPFPPLFIDASGTDLVMTIQPDEFNTIDWGWFITIYTM